MPERPAYQGQLLDTAGILTYIDAFCAESGIHSLEIDAEALQRALTATQTDLFPGIHVGPFKKTAAFMCAFSAAQPVNTPFPPDAFGEEITRIPNHQNAILAFEIGRAALQGAIIQTRDQSLRIDYRISVSKHMYVDIISFLAKAEPGKDVYAVALLLESLCYQSNPSLAYPEMA